MHQTKKIKVTILENNLVVGGVQRLVIDQLTALTPDMFEVHLITLTQPDRDDFYERVPKYVRTTRLHFKSTKDIKSWIQLIKILKAHPPDVVKSAMYVSNTIAGVLGLFMKFTVVTAEHNTKDGKNFIQRTINKILSKGSFTTIVDSLQVAEHLSQHEGVPLDRFTVIHNGVDLNKIRTAQKTLIPQRDTIRKRYGVQKDEKLFLSIARMVRQKNHIRMVEAFALLVKQQPTCKLMIVGGGGLKEAVKDRIKELNIGAHVILIDATKDIHQFYSISDFTLLSSDHEGFCISAMEGLAFGAPLVSTRVAGVVEYLEDGVNGYFAEKTPKDLAQKMLQITRLTDKELQSFQTAATATAENYSVEKYCKQFSRLLTEAVGQ